MKTSRILILPAVVCAAAFFAGCASTITPMRALERVEYVEDVPATQAAPGTQTASAPATQAATQVADGATQPATQPAARVTKVKFIDPNQTARFIYAARYEKIWEEAMAVLVREGYRIDRQDYREGVLTTIPRSAAHIMEVWRSDWTGPDHAAENTINTQRRSVRITIKPVEGKPDYYEIGIQVLVEREDNPSEVLQAPVFVEGSGFGRNGLSLQTDFLDGAGAPGATWRTEGHDIPAEQKLLDLLFKEI